jgi:sortase A
VLVCGGGYPWRGRRPPTGWEALRGGDADERRGGDEQDQRERGVEGIPAHKRFLPGFQAWGEWNNLFVSRRWMRRLGTLMIVLGLLGGAWVVTVWQWMDPFTALYTMYRQHQLSGQYEQRAAEWRHVRHGAARTQASLSLDGIRAQLVADARRYRHSTHEGEAIGKIVVPRLGLNMVLVNGTAEASLERGPGRDLRTYMPGQNRLVYIAGHRTTYLAPFGHIEQLRPGDSVTLEVPYATIRYSVTGHRIVPAGDLSRLNSPRHEVVVLQACHPRFFATHRYLVYALPRAITIDGHTYSYKKLRGVRLGSGPGSLQASRRTAAASRRS